MAMVFILVSKEMSQIDVTVAHQTGEVALQ